MLQSKESGLLGSKSWTQLSNRTDDSTYLIKKKNMDCVKFPFKFFFGSYVYV